MFVSSRISPLSPSSPFFPLLSPWRRQGSENDFNYPQFNEEGQAGAAAPWDDAPAVGGANAWDAGAAAASGEALAGNLGASAVAAVRTSEGDADR